MRSSAATLQLALSVLGALVLLGGALSFAAFGALQFFMPERSLDPTSTFLWAGSLAFAGLLVLPSAYFALQAARGRPALWAPDTRWVTGLSIFLLLAALPVVLILGNWIASNPHVAWFLLPPLHVLAVAIPVFWIGSLALRGLPVGSPRRFWGIFAAALTAGPLFILVVEVLAMVAAAVAAILFLSSQPGMAEQLQEILSSLQSTLTDVGSMEDLIEPLAGSPGPVLIVVGFVAIIVPFIEETLKPVGLWLLARRNLSPAEGFALGALSGSAYALFESLFLATGGDAWSAVVVARIGTAVLHILATALTGWGLALAWGQKKYWRLLQLYGLAVFLHAAWNALTAMNVAAVLMPEGSADPTTNLIQAIGRVAPTGLLALFIGCFAALIVLNRRHAAATRDVYIPGVTFPGPPVPADSAGRADSEPASSQTSESEPAAEQGTSDLPAAEQAGDAPDANSNPDQKVI